MAAMILVGVQAAGALTAMDASWRDGEHDVATLAALICVLNLVALALIWSI